VRCSDLVGPACRAGPVCEGFARQAGPTRSLARDHNKFARRFPLEVKEDAAMRDGHGQPLEAAPSSRRALVEAVIASTVGTTIEWYDFFLYGTMAALVFPALFFPRFDPFVGQILAFSTFTVGFLARPLGGVVFGYLGDRLGRKST